MDMLQCAYLEVPELAYEYESQKDVVVDSVLDIIAKAADGVQADELFPILNDVIVAVNAAQSVIGAEPKKLFKLKFAAKVGTGLVNKSLDQFIPDEPNA